MRDTSMKVILACPNCEFDVDVIAASDYVYDGTEWCCDCGAEGTFVEFDSTDGVLLVPQILDMEASDEGPGGGSDDTND